MIDSPWRIQNPRKIDGIFEEPDGWYFWDEIYLEKYGPFTSYKEAHDTLIEYARANLGIDLT